jgi:uncharacterized protein (TIGR03435 family)
MRVSQKATAVIAALFAVATGGTAADMKFEMADVHPSPHSSTQQVFMRSGFYRGGRYQIRSGTMVDLIGLAYGVDNDKVLSGPNWLDFDRFDILATAPANSKPEDVKAMLQALLAERFSLVIHVDKKEAPTFALTAGKKPLLKEADGSGETGCQFQVQGLPNNGRGGPAPGDGPQAAPTLNYTCHNMTMPALVEYMHTMPLGNQFLGTNPLVDETGLSGAWNLDFHYDLAMGPGGPSGAAMLDSFEKQTGLKLEARKVPLPVVIVDSANEKPTPNLPGVAEKLPVSPTEFEVADIKPSDPNDSGPGRGGGFQPGGRLDLRGITLKDLITIAWDTTPGLVAGGPKFIETDKFDIVAKAPASATTGAAASGGRGNQPPLDIDALRLMLKALIIDRFKLTTHMEDRPMDAYTLLADKPKLKKADPQNRTNFKEGPGPDGKDPRKDTPALGRLVTCQNMTMAQLAELLPSIAGGYFQTVSRTVLDSTGVEGAFDFTLSFSGAGILNGGNGGGRGGDGPQPATAGATGAAGVASDPGGGITLMDAMDKQIGIKMITTKRPVPVLVIDHIEQKPSDN